MIATNYNLDFSAKVKKWSEKIKVGLTFLILNVYYVSSAIPEEKKRGLIYILIMIQGDKPPFTTLEPETRAFINRQCSYQNCFVTKEINYFKDVTQFDVVLFNSINVKEDMKLPGDRSKDQLYVFSSIDPAERYQIHKSFNNFFNLTWTYKLDSDVAIPFIEVQNIVGNAIAPKKDVHWIPISRMEPLPKYIRQKIKNKKSAAAWFAGNCNTKGASYLFAKELQSELVHYGLQLDIFGPCGNMECPKDGMDECYALLESDYYFYLAFETATCEDYVTDQVLYGLQHFTVPIVYGGANYSRFIPNGIYLNALELGPVKLAKKMNSLIENRKKYNQLLKWNRYYSVVRTSEKAYVDSVCAFCSAINFLSGILKESYVFPGLVDWWNGKIAEDEEIPYP